jgi:2-dehydropantoate 2-reductase
MLQDVLRNAPTEIDAINGAIVQTGEETGVPTPIHRTLWQLVRSLHPQEIKSPETEPVRINLPYPEM